jgi:hypothetical protein
MPFLVHGTQPSEAAETQDSGAVQAGFLKLFTAPGVVLPLQDGECEAAQAGSIEKRGRKGPRLQFASSPRSLRSAVLPW